MNSPANAAHVGATTAGTVHDLLKGNPEADGSVQQIKKAQKDLEKYADLLAKNNDSRINSGNGFSDYRGAQKSEFKSYADGLIGANMDMLNSDIQDALRDLKNDATLSAYYNLNTPDGLRRLNELQDLALSDNLDTTLNGTNIIRPAIAGMPDWTDKEKQVITAIQVRNLARAVQNTHSQYQAGGYNNPTQEVNDFIDKLT